VKKLDRVIVVNAVKVGMNEIYLTILLFFRYLLIDFRTLTKKSNMGKVPERGSLREYGPQKAEGVSVKRFLSWVRLG